LKKSLLFSFSLIALFSLLMVYGLNHSSRFNPSPLAGNPPPSFQSIFSSGSLADSKQLYFPKKWNIVQFWSSSCVVCRNEAPEWERFFLVTKEKESRFNLISINIQDDKQTVDQWQKDYQQHFPVVLDPKGAISVDFGVTGTPETFFIDPTGIVRFRIAGEVSSDLILKFSHWLETHPKENQQQASVALAHLSTSEE